MNFCNVKKLNGRVVGVLSPIKLLAHLNLSQDSGLHSCSKLECKIFCWATKLAFLLAQWFLTGKHNILVIHLLLYALGLLVFLPLHIDKILLTSLTDKEGKAIQVVCLYLQAYSHWLWVWRSYIYMQINITEMQMSFRYWKIGSCCSTLLSRHALELKFRQFATDPSICV